MVAGNKSTASVPRLVTAPALLISHNVSLMTAKQRPFSANMARPPFDVVVANVFTPGVGYSAALVLAPALSITSTYQLISCSSSAMGDCEV